MNRLHEKKDSLIRRNPNLTEEQKQEIIEVLTRHPSYESKIDWNRNSKLTYEDFLNVLRLLYINDLDFRGLVEGEDYDLLLDKPKEKLYAIYTHNASKIIASNSVEPKLWTRIPSWCGREEKTDEAHAFGHFDSEHGDMKPGAKWCISMQTTDKSWNDYSKNFYFVFWIRDNEFLGVRDNQKIAIGIDKENGEIATIYNASDNRIPLDLPQYIKDTINENFNNIKKKRILPQFKLNLETGRYDCDGDLDSSILKDFVSEDRNGFTIAFGWINGYFDCSGLGLTSLEGAPQIVEAGFSCKNNKLTSLKGAPLDVVAGFYCSNNQLISLEGAPDYVEGCFYCENNKLTSLEGAPEYIMLDFNCSNNQLTSLKGAPEEVGGNFNCTNNPNLHSLEGIGKVKGEIYKDSHYLDNLNVESLEGLERVNGKIHKTRDF